MIKVENLSKHFHIRQPLTRPFELFKPKYKLLKAVEQLNFEIAQGELVGYLGPNGAGKSTTIKMLTGLLLPSEGDIVVGGFRPWLERQSYVHHIGAVFGQRSTLWWDLPVIDSFNLLKHIYHIPSKTFAQNLADFNDLLELQEFLQTPVRSLSLGQRMRADFCAALLHNPPLVFLDEPTIGLDVVAKERIREFIKHLNEHKKTTVLLTTHDLADVARLCQRVMIIDQGKLLFDGQLDNLVQRFGSERELIVDFAENYQDPIIQLKGLDLHPYEKQGRRASYKIDPRFSASELIQALSQNFSLQDVMVKEADIEATIRNIYEKRLL
ncbi:MAG: ATP-binding cassette domain-containing protein [Deinococcales bacterium]